MSKPTYQDAELGIKIFQLSSTPVMDEAFAWFESDEFVSDYAEFKKKYPVRSDGWMKAGKICSLYEMIGSLYKFDLINQEYLFDNLPVKMTWNRIKGIALGFRKESGDPNRYENFEKMANDPSA